MGKIEQGRTNVSELPSKFVLQELNSTTTYFAQVEAKMVSIVTLYATLVVAVVPGAVYRATNQAVRELTIAGVPSAKSLVLGAFLFLFSLISTFLLAVYTELRVRKIAMLEYMAASREFLVKEAEGLKVDLKSAIITVVGVTKCPKFLRRPSEDWYMVSLMSTVGGLFWAFSAFCGICGLIPLTLRTDLGIRVTLYVLSVALFIVLTYLHLSWVVRFCHEMDLRRDEKFGSGSYDYMSGKASTIPAILRPLDQLCHKIERKYAMSRKL
jgi:hypothetical protein